MAPSPGQPPTPRATNQMVGTYDQFSGTHNYRDPDGNHVEMQIDSFDTPDAATAYMEGPEYDADPIGPAFDVDRMLSAHRAGTPLAELITRAWALSGPRLPHPFEVLAAAAV